MKIRLTPLLLLALFAALPLAAKPLSNSDVTDLIASGLEPDTIVMLIQSSESDFDTSPAAIAQLAKNKTPNAIIQAMIQAKSGVKPGAAAATATAGAKSGGYDPETVLMEADGETVEMKYLIPQNRTAARGLGFGGMASYSVLMGSAARERIADRRPIFTLAVPERAQVESYVQLASFAVRRNNSREVLIGGGYMSYSTGIHPDRIVDVEITVLEDQSTAPERFVLYRVTPKAGLAPGEYALVSNNKDFQVAGFFAHGGISCFDFGVD